MNKLIIGLIIILSLSNSNSLLSQSNKKLAKKRVAMLESGIDMKVDSATYYLSLKLLKKNSNISVPDTGIRVANWPNGNMRFRGYIAEGGVFLGLRETWFENGNKNKEELCIRSDKYFNDSKCSYKNLWLENGEQIIKDGMGYYIGHHPNGQLQVKGEYKDGQRDGVWIWYHPNGNVHYESYYSAGIETGIWKFYNMDGEFTHEVDNNSKLESE